MDLLERRLASISRCGSRPSLFFLHLSCRCGVEVGLGLRAILSSLRELARMHGSTRLLRELRDAAYDQRSVFTALRVRLA